MDLDDFTPAGGGSLREPLGTFTQTQYVHPDVHWNPLGGEFQQGHGLTLAPATSPVKFGSATAQQDAEPGRPGADTGDFDLQATSRTIRSSLRPGL